MLKSIMPNKEEQHQADAEQRLAVKAAGVAHFRHDAGGEKPDAVKEIREVWDVAGNHDNRHGFADGASDAQNNSGDDAGAGSADVHLENAGHIGCAKSERTIVILRGNRPEGGDGDADDGREDHNGENQHGGQQRCSGGKGKEVCDEGGKDDHAYQSENH